MSPDPMLIMSGAIFVAVLLALDGVFALFAGKQTASRAVERRLRLSRAPVVASTQPAHLRRRGADTEHRESIFVQIDRLIIQAGSDMTLGRLFLRMGIALVGLTACFALVAGLPLTMALGLSLFLAPGAFMLYLLRRRSGRERKFTNQLPDALDIIVRSLRAGHPVTASLLMVAKQMPEPMGKEIGYLSDEMTYGMDLNQALSNLNQRVKSEELHFMTVAIKVQSQVGGNLAEVLGGLAKVIRSRRQMARRVRAISAEGRMSAWVISLMPFFVAGVVMVSHPAYFLEVLGDPIFPVGLGAGILLVCCGIYTVFRMVNFRV